MKLDTRKLATFCEKEIIDAYNKKVEEKSGIWYYLLIFIFAYVLFVYLLPIFSLFMIMFNKDFNLKKPTFWSLGRARGAREIGWLEPGTDVEN